MSTCWEPRRSRAAGDDGAIETETLSGLNASRSAGDAKAKLVIRHKCDFIYTGGGVEHAGSVRGVDLERGVMSGDECPRAAFEEMRCNRDGERGTFFRIGSGPEFVEQDKGVADRQGGRGG